MGSGTRCAPLRPDQKINQDCKSFRQREKRPTTKDTVCGHICACLHIDNECIRRQGQKNIKKNPDIYIKNREILRLPMLAKAMLMRGKQKKSFTETQLK